MMLLKLWIRVKRRGGGGGMSDKTSPIPPTSSTAPLKRSSFNSRIKTSNIPSISSTASQKKSSCKSRAKTSKIPPTSYVPASPKDTSLNNTDNDALLAKVLSEMDKEEHDSYLRPRGKNYRFTKPKSEKKEQTNKEVQCATSAQWVRVEELKKYLHFDRDIQTLSGKGKQYMDELWSEIEKSGLKNPLSLSVSKKTGRAVIFDGNHRLTIFKNKNVEWFPLKVSYFFIEDDFDKSFSFVPCIYDEDNWPSKPTPRNIGFSIKQ